MKRYRDQITIIHVVTVVRACKRARLMTSYVSIYFCWRQLQRKTLQRCRFTFMYHVRNEIILCCELSSNNAWCCRADANINSRRLHLATMCYSTIIHSREFFFLNSNITLTFSHWAWWKCHGNQSTIIHVVNVVLAKGRVWWRRM